VQTVADGIGHQTKVETNSRLTDVAAVVGGSLLMAVCAHVSIPLWFTPVPITLQTFGVLLLALTLGGRRSAAALVLYLIEGASGLPVFSLHGLGGAAQIIGPTGGYLMAYPIAAFAGGLIAHNVLQRSRLLALVAGAVVCELIIFLFGATWLGVISHQPGRALLVAAVLPFLPGEVLKIAAAVGLALRKPARLARA
jgi:biotin transport system substrate-specific component